MALIDEIDSLKATVKVLQNRLSFVLSYLGIAENSDLSNAVSQSSSALSEVTVNDSEVTNGNQPTRSYADVIQRSTVPTALNGRQLSQLYMPTLRRRIGERRM